MLEANIILTGFMGAGKTAVGLEVAARMGRRLVDMDELIVERTGKSIPNIFAQDGEPAFRALEAAICRDLREPAGLVVATGGGAALNAANREALGAGGVFICLDATPEVILQRIGDDQGRPMLASATCHTPHLPNTAGAGYALSHKPYADRLARVRELLAQRADAYAAVPHHVDTTYLSIEAAAERVMGIAAGLPDGGHRLTVLPLSPSSAYEVLIASGLLGQAGQRIAAAGLKPGRCAVVTNPIVGQLYAAELTASLAAAGFEPLVFEVTEGEAHKTLDTAAGLYARLAAAKLARNEAVIALGGGVIGDLAGFVAATWLRGVPFIQIPTSLLSMVDASVGGKVAVDLPAGKNLVGAFKQPEVVLIDPDLLSTLPGAEFRSGLAEIVKHGIIGDPGLFEQLATTGPASLTAMIADAVRVKVRLVERDPLEMGDRAWLNLGHTFGHALELLSGYTLRHGEAVALGTVAAGELSAALGYCGAAVPARVRQALERLGLPTRHAFDPVSALAAMSTDKKRRGRSLRFVLVKRIGEVTTVEGVEEAAVLAALETICGA